MWRRPASGPNRRGRLVRVALPCLLLTAPELIATTGLSSAQTVTPDLFSPNRQSQVINPESPLRRTTADAMDPLNGLRLPDADPSRRALPSSTSTSTSDRVGQVPTYGLPAANGAATSGYDALNRKRLKPKYYPGQAKPKPPRGGRFQREQAAAAQSSSKSKPWMSR